MIDVAVKKNIVDKSGSWYAYNGKKLGQGKENAKIFLKEHPEVFEEIHAKILES